MLNNDQIKLVQTAVRKAGIRTVTFDGRYRMLLSQYLQPSGKPVTSCKQLNNSQLDDILAICEAHGWQMPGKSETFYRDKVSKAGEYASFAQQEAIRHLGEDLGMVGLHLSNFIGFMTDHKADNIAELLPQQAYKIIEGLKAIIKRKTGKVFHSLQEVKDYYMEGATDGKANQVG
jgi:hypothetical protein